jgi:hypothetical protein
MSSSVSVVQGEGAMFFCQEIIAYGLDFTSQTEIGIFCRNVFLVFKTILFLYRRMICPCSSISMSFLFFAL